MLQKSLLLGAILLTSLVSSAQAEGALEAIRNDVRNPLLESPSSPVAPAERPQSHERFHDDTGREEVDNFCNGIFLAGFYVGAYAVTSPFWIPRALMDDDSNVAYFPRFPYDDTSGYLKSDAWLSNFSVEKALADRTALQPVSGDSNAARSQSPNDTLTTLATNPSLRRWGGQFRADYTDNFSHLSGIGGELILETTSRFGIDTTFRHLTERFPDASDDHLDLGDCNVIYRFAQSPWGQMRTGIGLNWLNDSTQTDLGFNFTYSGDFFPRKPWVLSAAIDWGTLGHAGLFRFRTTAGAIFNRFEGYVGYEYLDIGSTQDNFLIGGVRVWF